MSKTLLFGQFLISMMMAFVMSGIMGAIALGPTELWLHTWPRSFITAWPIAFVLSVPIGGFAFWVAGKLLPRPVEAAAVSA